MKGSGGSNRAGFAPFEGNVDLGAFAFGFPLEGIARKSLDVETKKVELRLGDP